MSAGTSAFQGAVDDVRTALSHHWLWRALARSDIRNRYGRSLLGSLWVTANLALMVGTLTLIFAVPLGLDVPAYAKFVAIGLILWQFVQSVLNEAPQMFVAASDTIRNTPVPISTFAFRLVYRNLLLLAHQLPVLVVVLLVFGLRPTLWLLTLPVALLLWAIVAFSAALLLGLAGARFRDVEQLVANALQLLFFLTPIFWTPRSAGMARLHFAEFNPLFAIIDIVRAPLLGSAPSPDSWPIATGTALICAVAGLMLFARVRQRVAYWI